MTTFKLDRRVFLRGAIGTGVAVGLCPLDAMFDGNGKAHADGGPIAKRFLLWFFGNGVYQPAWHPSRTGAAPDLPESLSLLAPVRSYVRTMSGLNTVYADGHDDGMKATIMGRSSAGITVDQVAAHNLGTTRFESIQLGLCRGNRDSTFKHNCSFNDRGSALPPEMDPRAAFDRIFGTPLAPSGSGATDADLARAERRKHSVLDAVKRDLGRLTARLGTGDRARIDEHLESIRALERSLFSSTTGTPTGAGATAACTSPSAPPATSDIAVVSRQMNDLMALAFACDQTRALSYLFSGCQTYTFMTWLDVPADEHWHGCSHGGGWETKITTITRWMMGELAQLIGRLAAIPEGAGTVMDSTIVLVTSETGHADDHGGTNMPCVVAGGPALVRGDYHWGGSGEPVAAAGLACLQALGCPVSALGMATRPIPLT